MARPFILGAHQHSGIQRPNWKPPFSVLSIFTILRRSLTSASTVPDGSGSQSGGDRAAGRTAGSVNRPAVRVLRGRFGFIPAALALLPHLAATGGDGIRIK